MQGLVLGASTDDTRALKRVALSESRGGYDEAWLQSLMHENPGLVPLSQIAPGSLAYIPICRELSIPKPGGLIYLDLFGVTPTGKLVLIECKLWRNPQARREVVAQALEYASLIRTWSYADLTARLKGKLNSASDNPLYDMAKHHSETIDEAAFVDQVTQSLATGDFILIIAGDGIRSNVQAMTDHLNDSSSSAIFSLLEIELWEGQDGSLTVLPMVPFKTRVFEHRVLVNGDGRPLETRLIENDEIETERQMDPSRAADQQAAQAFWQRFIDAANFDHADQLPPRHHRHNNVVLPMPGPCKHLTAYRLKIGQAGFFMNMTDVEGQEIFSQLSSASDALAAEIEHPIEFSVAHEEPFKGRMEVKRDEAAYDEEETLQWLLKTANALVTALRTRLGGP